MQRFKDHSLGAASGAWMFHIIRVTQAWPNRNFLNTKHLTASWGVKPSLAPNANIRNQSPHITPEQVET